MKGAIAEPLLKKIRILRSIRQMIIGKSQNFFLVFRKPQRSRKKSIFISAAIHSIRVFQIVGFL